MRLIEPEQITKMMSDLFISKDAVNMTGERQGLWVRFRAIEKAVSEIPTIDAVEVVRCKDCKHAHMTYGGECKYCDMWVEDGEALYLDGDFFCAYGERREP